MSLRPIRGRALRRPLVLGVALAAWTICAQSSDAPPPALDIVLEPHSAHGVVDYVDVHMTIGQPDVGAGGTLLRMPLQIVSIPTARYDGEAIKARDSNGELALTQQDEPPTPTGTFRRWLPSRKTVGDVSVSYRAPPRAVSASTRAGPLFDLRAEGGGMNGAGITFLALPDTTHPHRIHLRWDLADMPPGSRGVWSLGEGAVRTVGPAQQLAFSYYVAGPMNRYPSDPSSDFAMYWFGKPPFDTQAVAARIQTLFAYMAQFFRDEKAPYRVFIRKNPYASGGGTALARSFMFGYSDANVPTPEKLQGLLAHEMTHNWPSLQGEHGEIAWYTEGAAEYYSILLSHRAGLLDVDAFLQAVNGRASGYYSNPLRSLTNEEAAQRFWKDSRAQRVPYGRGFMYFARVDAQLREKSAGRRRLDDLVLEVRTRQAGGKAYGIREWLELVTAELGPDARKEFEAMTQGRLVVPPASSFAPCLKPEKLTERAFELGFDPQSVGLAGSRIQGLVVDSAAARAGVRDGDEVVVPVVSIEDIQSSPEATLTLKLRRNGQPFEVTFLPRGASVESYRWTRVAGVEDSACKL